VVHSLAASNGQTNRLFKGYDIAGSLKHLTYVQITDFYKKNKTAEFYLMYLKTLYPLFYLVHWMRSIEEHSKRLQAIWKFINASSTRHIILLNTQFHRILT